MLGANMSMFSLSSGAMCNILVVVGASLLCAFAYLKHKFSYWKKKGVPFEEAVIPFGSIGLPTNRHIHIVDQFDTLYKNGKKQNSKIYGFYTFTKPDAIVTEPELLKKIMIKDFNNFHDRGFPFDEENDPLTAHLLSQSGEKWKNLRNHFSPAFTSGKLKTMFSIMADCTKGLSKCMDDSIRKAEPVEMKDLISRFTTDVIASCAFGVEVNSLENPDCEFRKYGKKIFEQSFISQIKNNFILTFPNISKALKMRVFPEDMTQFFLGLVKSVVQIRKTNNIKRNDIMHNIIELMDHGKMEGSDLPATKKLSLNEAAAQAFVFFIGGFDTSSSAITLGLYEISQQQKIQDKLRSEIINVLKKHKNTISYEAIADMKYLDQVISETLRMYPSVALATRIAKEDYFIPEIERTINKNTMVFIPIYSLHRDAEYFPNPLKFDPERFSDANKENIREFTYMPFGDGPRNCIGKRFGLLQMKLCFATLLTKYKFTLNPKTKTPLTLDVSSGNLVAAGGLWLDAHKM